MLQRQEITVNLIKLRDRLNDIIAENERRGRGERNTLPVYVEIKQPRTPKGRLRESVYVPLESHVRGSMLTLNSRITNDERERCRVDCMCLETITPAEEPVPPNGVTAEMP
jgi:hypothetical protein